MDPISVTSNIIGVVAAAFQILNISQSAFRSFSQIDKYLDQEPESVTESHIRRKHGAFFLNAIRFLMPGVISLLQHIDADVLHGNDDILLEFRKSYINDCNMTSVAGAIVTQVAITALSLPYLSQSHWVARACFVISLISGTLSVFFAVLLQRIIGSLYEVRTLRAWLSSLDIYPDMKDLKALENILQLPSTQSRLNTSEEDVEAARNLQENFAALDLKQRRVGVVSLFSTVILETPRSMINISLGSFLTGLAVYFGFLWTRNLDTNAGPGDSRNVFIIFVITVICCIGMYSVPRGLKRSDEYVASVYSRIRSKLDLMITDAQNQARNESSDNSPPEAGRNLPPDGDAELNPNNPSIEVPAPQVRGPSPTSPQNTVLTAALRRAMQAHQELGAAELALSKVYADILAAAETVRNTTEDL
ncbi:hypothetical protein ACLOAV_000901 [Pseudogymnoascus australis]